MIISMVINMVINMDILMDINTVIIMDTVMVMKKIRIKY